MASLTKTEGKTGVLSYGLYMIYKARFKYRIDRKGSMTEVLPCDRSILEDNNVKYSDKRSEANVPYHVWLRICKKFNHLIIKSIFAGFIFDLPYKLGSLGIIQKQMKITFGKDGELIKRNLSIDWNNTLILWRKSYPECKTKEDFKKIRDKPLCYYTNEHSDGRRFMFHWKKKYISIKNKSVYCFNVAKQHKEGLRDLIYSNPNIQFCTKF